MCIRRINISFVYTDCLKNRTQNELTINRRTIMGIRSYYNLISCVLCQ